MTAGPLGKLIDYVKNQVSAAGELAQGSKTYEKYIPQIAKINQTANQVPQEQRADFVKSTGLPDSVLRKYSELKQKEQGPSWVKELSGSLSRGFTNPANPNSASPSLWEDSVRTPNGDWFPHAKESARAPLFITDAKGNRQLNPRNMGVMLTMATMGDVQAVPGISQTLASAAPWVGRTGGATEGAAAQPAYQGRPAFQTLLEEAAKRKDYASMGKIIDAIPPEVAKDNAGTIGIFSKHIPADYKSVPVPDWLVGKLDDVMTPVKTVIDSAGRAQQGVTNLRSLSDMTHVDPISEVKTVTGSGIPQSQSDFAAALNSSDINRVRAVLDQIPDTDPYKQGYLDLLNRAIQQGRMPHTTLGGQPTEF